MSSLANVNGKLVLPDGGAPLSGSIVQLDLKNYGSSQPQADGTVVFPQKQFQLATDGSWSGTLYRNDSISCNGVFPTYWAMTYFSAGGPVYPAKFIVVSQSSADLDTLPALNPTSTLTPLPTPLTGSESALFSFPLAASTWTGIHNFGTQAVHPTFYDLSWNEILPDTAVSTDVNTFTATFLEPQAGFMVVVNVGNWTPSVTNPNNIIGNPTSSQTIIGDFPLTIGGSVATRRLNGQRIAEQFSGANGGAQINSALSDLGSSAGRVIADEGMTFGGFNAPANNQSIWDYRGTQDILNNAPPGTLSTRPTVLTINQNLGEFSTAALTGTVTLTNGSTVITGVGTKFTTEINPAYFFGPSIRLSADGVTKWAEVLSVTDDTHATLKANYTGTGGSGAGVILVGQEGLSIRATSTAGTPNTYAAGEWVGLSVFGFRSGGERGIYGANFNLTYNTPVQATQGQAFGLEIDITNNSGVDAPLTGSIGLDLNAVGANRCGTAINIGGQWSNGLIMSGWSGVGLYLQGGSNHMQFTPTADNANVQLQGFNAAQSATTWKINNDGSSLFAKNMNLTNSPLPLTCSSTTGSSQIRIDVLSGNFAGIQYTNTGNQRWLVGKNGTAESGSNVGSDFDIDRYNDAGTFQDTPLTIKRSTGLVTCADGIQSTTHVLTAVAPTVAAAQVGLGSTTATSATAGANGAVPAQVVGYLIANVAGTAVKIPYFAT